MKVFPLPVRKTGSDPHAVLRIHDILVWIWIRIRVSMPLTNGSGCDPDPSIFIIDLQDAKKN
jgi:hypothetical protein